MSATPQDPPVYLVLGATGRVGVALCRRLAAQGARLLVAAHDTARLAALSDEIHAPAVSLNATRVEHVDGCVSQVLQVYGRLDGVVNCVAPGPLLGPDGPASPSPPLGRYGHPSEVASAIAWLLSPEQSWVTRQVVGVHGGLSTLRPL